MWRTSIIFCLIALLIAPFELVMLIFVSVLVQYLAFLTVVSVVHSLGTVFLDWMMSHKQNFVCWPSVGPQDIKHTYIHTYIHVM